MPYLWLILQILPLLLIVAALFYWLGLRQPRADLISSLAAKQEALDREQTKADGLSRQLSLAEEQINQLTSEYENLQRGAIPRRLLSEAENEIIKLQRQLAIQISPTTAQAPSPPKPETISERPAAEPAEEALEGLSLAEILASLPPSPEPAPAEVPPTVPGTQTPEVAAPPSSLELTQPLFVESSGTPKPPAIQKRRKKSDS